MAGEVKVLIFGGCGFIGQHLATELLENNVASYVRVVDKVPPQMAWLNKKHVAIFNDPRLTFKSANLINPASCESSFGETEYDWVINAAGETKTGQEEAVYKEGILKVSTNCAKAASFRKVKVFIEISSGQMSSSEKIPMKESDPCLPWSLVAKYKYEAEAAVRGCNSLNWIIIRPALVYGEGDKHGLTPRLLIGTICRYLGTPMKLLWDKDLKMNTVHVKDLCRAMVWLCQRGKTKEIYHIVDDAVSTQGMLTKIICNIFNTEYEFCGSTLSKLAMTEGESVVQLANETHLEPWAKMCSAKNLTNTPLTPYIDIEMLSNKHLHLDGSKIRNEGFLFEIPKPTKENLMQILDDFIAMNLLPHDIYSVSSTEIL